ncbi:MAG TPA: A24 family peptidase [Bryobacteraceae bacterium]|nr:A24 family peptidase [Bryobacteraceae bacterium]
MSPVATIVQAALLALVLTAAVYDFRFRRIPNWLAVTGFCAGLALNTVLGGWGGLGLSLAGFGAAFGIYFLLYMIHAMGAGDVKLMGAVGSLVGASNWMVLFASTAIVGGLAAIVLVIVKGRLRQTFWNIGFILSELLHFRAPYMTKDELDVKSEKAVTLPHGVSIAMGTVVLLYLLWTPVL